MCILGGMILDWFYEEGPRGPENWKNICAIFHKAENESLQSPINLKEEEVTAEMDGNLLAFDYHATNFRSSFFNHTVHLNPVAGEKINHVVFNHKRYTLEDIHFHLPSEHLINSQQFPLEMHLVHRSAKNELLVIGVVAEPTQVPLNKKLAKIDNIALNPRNAARGIVVPILLNQLLPEKRTFFNYSGSLTTPPTEGPVEWLVFKMPVYMRQGLLKAFEEQIGKTNRPVQERKGRPIYLADK